MKIDTEEGKCFYLRFVYFLSHIQPIREYLWTICKKKAKTRLNNSTVRN